MRNSIILLILIIPLTSQAKSVPSFSCLGAYSNDLKGIEMRICSNNELGNLDLTLNSLYQIVIEEAKNPEKIKREQLDWLKLRRTKCFAHKDPCLIELYRRRISDLDTYLDCDRSWCDRIIHTKINNILTDKLETYRDKLRELIARRIRDARDEFVQQKYQQLRAGLNDQQEHWENYVEFTCRPKEEFIGGTGEGDRIRSCKRAYLQQQIIFYEELIDLVRSYY